MKHHHKKSKAAFFGMVCVGGVVALLWTGKQQGKAVQMVQARSQESLLENWRGAPVGDGEDTLDSYHSYDHRPPVSWLQSRDSRDELLMQYTIHRCPNNGTGTMVSGQDARYFENGNIVYKERNPKYLCDVHKLPSNPRQPCVVYSFGSWDEISFEVGINKVTRNQCEIHTFDPAKLPSVETGQRNHFTPHDLGISNVDNGKFQRVSTIMNDLGHSHVHVLKIDVEGHEQESLPALVADGTLSHVDQLSIEFHSNNLMKEGLDLLEQNGFGIVYARREDRCPHCIEVTMVKLR